MNGRRAVAELGGADDDIEAAIATQRRLHFGQMAERRYGIDHAERNALPDQPIVGFRRRHPAARDRARP